MLLINISSFKKEEVETDHFYTKFSQKPLALKPNYVLV